jgi:hypothetical protein
MKVERVNATIRYSREENGAWKSLELGAEASIGLDDDWQISQALLYTQRADQLKSLWRANGQEHAQNGPERPVEPDWEEIKAVPLPQEHWCSIHHKQFRKYEKDGKAWFSHKNGDSWCKEQPSTKATVAKAS